MKNKKSIENIPIIFILLSCVFILIDIFKNSNKYLTFMNRILNKYWYLFILILVIMFLINNIIVYK